MTITKPLARTSFNSGELDPALHTRPDISKYQNGCKKLENMLINPTGGVKRRPQTSFMASLPNNTENVRLLPFEFANDTTFAVLLIERPDENVYIEVYENDGTQAFQQEVDYPAGSLSLIKYAQSYDVMWLVHPLVPVMRLERRETGWAFVEHNFEGGPYDDQNVDRKKKIRMVPVPWVDGDSYEVGDHVVDYNIGDVIDQTGASDIVTATSPPYRTVALDNGNTREYKELIFKVSDSTNIPEEGYVFFTGFTGLPPGSDLERMPFRISNVLSPLGGEIFVIVKSGLYIEEDPGGSVVEDQLSDIGLDYNQSTGTGEVTAHFCPDLTRDIDIYQCVQATSSALVTNDSYWKPVGSYKGPIIVDTEDFSEDLLAELDSGDYLAFRVGQEFSQRGGFTLTTVGTYLRLKNGEGDPAASGDYEAGDTSDEFPIKGTVKLETKGGTWSGRLRLQTSEDNGNTWETFIVIESVGNNNERVEREVYKTGVLGRLIYDNAKKLSDPAEKENPDKCLYILNISTTAYTEIRKADSPSITTKTSIAYFDLVTNITETQSTFKWARRAFNEQYGYPGTVTLFEQRLWFSGVANTPNRVYASEVDEFEEWGEGIFETSPLIFTISSDQFNPIYDILPQLNLVIFTSGAEYSIGSRNSQELLSGTTVSNRRHSQYGSANIQTQMLQEVGIYVERDARTIRAMAFTDEFDSYSSTDMTSFARHITREGVKETSIVRSPENYLFCLREDGQIPVMTYDRQQEVLGWSRLLIGDGVLTMVSTPAPKKDSVYLVAKRGSERFLERIGLGDASALDWGVKATEASEGVGVVDFELPHDTDEDLVFYSGFQKLAEGTDFTRSGTTVTMITNKAEVIAGFEYQHEIETTDLQISPTGKGGNARIIAFDLYHAHAAGGEFRLTNESDWKEIVWAPINGDFFETLGNANQQRTVIDVGSKMSDQLSIGIRGKLPAPFELYGIGLNAERTQ